MNSPVSYQLIRLGLAIVKEPSPLMFTPECWNGILLHPCQHPQAFDKIAMTACQVYGFANPEVCSYVGYAFRKVNPQEDDTCTSCITKAQVGKRVINTLVYHTQAPVGCERVNQSCQVNGTMYMLCHQKGQIICYQPETVIKINISVWAGIEFESEDKPYVETGYESSQHFEFINSTTGLKNGVTPLVLELDVCKALDSMAGYLRSCGSQAWRETYTQNHKYLLPCDSPANKWESVCEHTGTIYKGCPYVSSVVRIAGTNRIRFTVSQNIPDGYCLIVGIDGTGSDPQGFITF
ncbi:hypothetical protein E2320_022679, partial [Naja naja]